MTQGELQMATFAKIFDVFSRRSTLTQNHVIPNSTRNRILKWCVDVFSGSRSNGFQSDYRNQFWQEIGNMLQYKHGKLKLSKGTPNSGNIYEDVYYYLQSCTGEDFLDFIEYVFRVN